MKLLAIDPGNFESAYLIWDGERPLAFGKCDNELLLLRIREILRAQTDRCVIEMIGHYGLGMPAGKTIFDTCVWIGRFGERYGWERVEVMLRPTVKAHICGSSRAKDGNVRQALIDRLGAPGTKRAPGLTYGISADVWQALAVAVAFWDRSASLL